MEEATKLKQKKQMQKKRNLKAAYLICMQKVAQT